MANIIKGHNNKLTNTKVRQQLACNCRVKSDCPLNGDCRRESIVYKCTACTIRQLKKVYLGLTQGNLKHVTTNIQNQSELKVIQIALHYQVMFGK